jgi:hypothetical protein
MHTLLTILAIFLGVFGFAFGLAGAVGMMRFDRKEGVGLTIIDGFLAGGVLTMLSDIAANWSHRPEQRRLIYTGLFCSALCVVAIIAARRLDEQTPPEKRHAPVTVLP